MTNLSSIVEMLAKQALGNNQAQSQQRSSQQGGLADILGSVLGHINNANQQNQNPNQQHQNSQQQNKQNGLGAILGSVLSQLGGGSQSSARPSSGLGGSSTTKTLLIAVLPLVLAWIQKQGGLQGALDKLKGQGLNSQVDDWVSTGPGENANVDPQQVQNLFDDQEVEQVAQETHVPKQDVYSAISQVLPQIIDSLTPQGEQTSKQEANNDIQNVLNMVSGLFKK
ncbi:MULTISPECIES: YidB family protein [Acinetobacter]|uniref:YidB family protein n=1 Tax=Acinetobacter TaxID=469 RepID=UPI0015D240A0|nr:MULTISPECIES: YidB family protein [Acinetobacter]UXI50258.1 YidB family protein [Acinetobacter variabilis]